MSRIKLTLQYKGTNYHGWQIQPNGITIQEVLQKALCRIIRKKVHVIGAGRTDSGVHALGYVCHVDVSSLRGPLSLWGEGVKPRWGNAPLRGRGEGECEHAGSPLQHGLNSLLPNDIVITSIEPVSDNFHAQKSAKRKIYDYSILNARVRSPFLQDYVWQIPYPLDIKKMRKAAKYLIGKHDFKSFCGSGSSVKTTVRRIYRVSIVSRRSFLVARLSSESRVTSHESRLIRITIEGNGFLKHMVRNIVGTLVQVGRGKMTLTQFKKTVRKKDRRVAGPTAPAKGLMLRKVTY